MRPRRRLPAWLAALTAVSLTLPGCARPKVETNYLESSSLGGRVRFQVLLPSSYDSRNRYPVLWLLHGYGGDDSTWLKQTSLQRLARRYQMIIVMPQGGRSFYANSPVRADAAYETFLMEELHRAVIQRYQIDTLREAVAGASMGGYGAAVLSLRFPGRFRFAGLVIPALSLPDSLTPADSAYAPWLVPVLDSTFGPHSTANRASHDPFLLLRDAGQTTLPYFYVAAAKADPFPSYLPLTRRWVQLLGQRDARHEYRELPFGHEPAALEAALPSLLESCWRALTPSPSRP
jgi:S-formylglutathione hydrolase FrmB